MPVPSPKGEKSHSAELKVAKKRNRMHFGCKINKNPILL